MTKKHNIKVTLKVLRLFDKKKRSTDHEAPINQNSPFAGEFLDCLFCQKRHSGDYSLRSKALNQHTDGLCITKAKVKKTVSKMVVKGLWVRRLAQRTPWGVFLS
mgnify:CR=1 FL=1